MKVIYLHLIIVCILHKMLLFMKYSEMKRTLLNLEDLTSKYEKLKLENETKDGLIEV